MRERKLLIFCLDVEDTDYYLLFPRPSSDVMIKLSIRAKEPAGPAPQCYIVITSLPAPALSPEQRDQ